MNIQVQIKSKLEPVNLLETSNQQLTREENGKQLTMGASSHMFSHVHACAVKCSISEITRIGATFTDPH